MADWSVLTGGEGVLTANRAKNTFFAGRWDNKNNNPSHRPDDSCWRAGATATSINIEIGSTPDKVIRRSCQPQLY